jgi:hypothetical protein
MVNLFFNSEWSIYAGWPPGLVWAITKWFLLFDGEEPPTRYSLRLNLSLLDVIVFESAHATIEMFLANVLCSARLYQRDFGL